MVARWVEQDRAELPDPEALLARTVADLPEVEEVWGEVLRRFARLALDR